MPDRDPFERLADRLRALAREEATAAAPSFTRFEVVGLSPLAFRQAGGGDTFTADDEDVDLHRAVTDLADAGDLDVGDVVDVRETEDGWEVVGVIADA